MMAYAMRGTTHTIHILWLNFLRKICTLFVSVTVISTKLLSEGTIFTFPTRDAGHRSHAKF